MTRDDVIAILRANESQLRSRGVARVALFGSVARDQATSKSDVDIMVDIDPAADVDLYGYVAITQFIAQLFSEPVDVADHALLLEPVRRRAEQEAIYAF